MMYPLASYQRFIVMCSITGNIYLLCLCESVIFKPEILHKKLSCGEGVLYTEQHPRGSFACFESRSVFPRLTVKPGCCSQWLFCVERVPLNATVCSPGVISTHPLHRRQGGEETSLQMSTLNSVHALSRVCAKSHSDRGTHTYMHTLIHKLIQRLLVLNNDKQLPRMSMSLPVFVRSYLVLLWKLNVILKNPGSLCILPSL